MTNIDRRTLIAAAGAAAVTLPRLGSANAQGEKPPTDNLKGLKMDNVTTRITADKRTPGHWRGTINHPPINTVDIQVYYEAFDLVEPLEAHPSLQVFTFNSANPHTL